MNGIPLIDLKPVWRRVYVNRTPENRMGGEPTDMFELDFICPTCGSPYIIGIKVAPEMRETPDHRCWKADPMPDGSAIGSEAPSWPSRLTVTPSIDYTHAGHGRRHPTCSFHGHIINGQVVLS
jgi:hypothetical protein